jgi:L-threonylcarbamoyladenylate synthase
LAKVLTADRHGIREAAEIVRKDGVVAYPTETVFGLGCNPFSEKALARLGEAKGGREKPLPVLVRDIQKAEQLATFIEIARKLASAFWPGPLTLVLPLKRRVPSRLTAGRSDIGLRMPNHDVALSLLDGVEGFLVGTSANPTGEPPCTSHEAIVEVFGDRVDAVVEGRGGFALSSTVVEIRAKDFRILREGPITQSMIRNILAGQ